jgi:tetratricopeptide (TPR) repeat protein
MQEHSIPKRLSWCIWFLMLLLTAGAIGTAAQTPAPSRFDRLVANAEKGDAAAQVELGILYYEGLADSRRPDYAKALEWFQRAADQGDAKAQDRIGLMYYSGKGVPQDFAQAAHWYQLAAQGGNYHARLQLSDMYQRGLGVPRDLSESRKWARQATADHPDREPGQIRAVFAVAVLAVIAFTFGLIALQRNSLSGWKHLVVAILVNVTGIALVLNTLTTYGFGIVFPHCSHSFLATDCTQISDPHTRAIVNQIGDFAVVNLIFRFMAGVGLVLDALAVWYVVYLCRLLIRRPRARVPGAVPSRNF